MQNFVYFVVTLTSVGFCLACPSVLLKLGYLSNENYTSEDIWTFTGLNSLCITCICNDCRFKKLYNYSLYSF